MLYFLFPCDGEFGDLNSGFWDLKWVLLSKIGCFIYLFFSWLFVKV